MTAGDGGDLSPTSIAQQAALKLKQEAPDLSTSSNVSVFLRIRPVTEEVAIDATTGLSAYEVVPAATSGGKTQSARPKVIRSVPPSSSQHSQKINRQIKEYSFSEVFPSSSNQEQVYNATAAPLVANLFKGVNGLLFAYGMTNAGKTFTTLGTAKQPGLLPRSLEACTTTKVNSTDSTTFLQPLQDLFSRNPKSVTMSFLEIYNENIFDLLPEDPTDVREPLKLQDRGGKIEIRNLARHGIASKEDAMQLVIQGGRNRKVASTKLNEDSSRSHSICTIEVDNGAVLWIVDLAGSERSKRTGAAGGHRQKEANSINLSLATLWRCLQKMRSNQTDRFKSMPPFRESRLTHLFMNHLAGSSTGRTVMVVNINPSLEDFDETQHVLTNSAVAQEVKALKDLSGALRSQALLNTKYGKDGRRIGAGSKTNRGKGKRKKQAREATGLVPKAQRSRHAAAAAAVEAEAELEESEESEGEGHRGSPGGGEREAAMQAGSGRRLSVIPDLAHPEVRTERLQATVNYLKQRQRHGDGDSSQPKGTGSEMGVLLELLEKQLASKKRPAGADSSATSKGEGGVNSKATGRKAGLLAYLGELEGRVVQAEALNRQLKAEHALEVAELEQEFDLFLEENGLNDESAGAVPATVQVPAADSMAVSELEAELRNARAEAQSWKKEAQELSLELEARQVAEKEALAMAASSAMLLEEQVVETVLEELVEEEEEEEEADKPSQIIRAAVKARPSVGTTKRSQAPRTSTAGRKSAVGRASVGGRVSVAGRMSVAGRTSVAGRQSVLHDPSTGKTVVAISRRASFLPSASSPQRRARESTGGKASVGVSGGRKQEEVEEDAAEEQGEERAESGCISNDEVEAEEENTRRSA
ncbi:unnamed protein product, partial [Chrysoparadoxa australica]